MMLNVAIVPDLNAPGGGIGMSAMHHDAAGDATNHAMPAMSHRPSP